MHAHTIEWSALKNGLIEYLASKQYSLRYRADILSYLDKYVDTIDGPKDIIGIFANIKNGRRHLWLALRVLFNYLEAIGADERYLNGLRKAMPKVQCGIDLKVPDEAAITRSLARLPKALLKYQALYNVMLDSGLRLVEAVKIVNNFNAEKVKNINNHFYRVDIGEFRGSKQAYYAYFTKRTYDILRVGAPHEHLTPTGASRYYQKYGFVAPKYVRKFVFDKMIELEIPESVADFIQSRVAKRIGAKHYMALARQANRFYGRYAEYIEKLTVSKR